MLTFSLIHLTPLQIVVTMGQQVKKMLHEVHKELTGHEYHEYQVNLHEFLLQ